MNEKTTERTPSAEVIELLGLTPRQIRLVSAVHEAGHVVVADTVGAFIHHAQVTSSEHFGEGDGDHVDLEMPGADEVPFPEHLIILAAGFQASFFWARGRRFMFTDLTKLNRALNMLAAGDHGIVADLRERWQRPDVRVQDAAPPVAKILARRWSTVLRIAYDLARAGTLHDHELRTRLDSGPAELRIKAREIFHQWRDEFELTHPDGETR